MSVLVTGATGFIGSHLCCELVDRGYAVIGLTQGGSLEKLEPLLSHSEFTLLTGDVRDRDLVEAIFQKHRIGIVFHQAARLPTIDDLKDPFSSFSTNAGGTLNLLHAASRYDVRQFVYGSSIDVYAQPPAYLPVDEAHPTEPLRVYGVGKLSGELLCHAFSSRMRIAILRYSGVYGPGQPEGGVLPMFIRLSEGGMELPIHGDGSQSCDFVDVRDVVIANILAAEARAEAIYNVGSGQETTVRELAEMIVKMVDSPSKIVFDPSPTHRPFRFLLDIRKAHQELGYVSRPLQEGLSEYLRKTRHR